MGGFELRELFAVFGELNRARRRAQNFDARCFESRREVERSLSAKLDDNADRLFKVNHVEHVFKC